MWMLSDRIDARAVAICRFVYCKLAKFAAVRDLSTRNPLRVHKVVEVITRTLCSALCFGGFNTNTLLI